jgi:hypothetical protein
MFNNAKFLWMNRFKKNSDPPTQTHAAILSDKRQKISGGSIVQLVKRRLVFGPGNIAVEQRGVDMPLAPAQ